MNNLVKDNNHKTGLSMELKTGAWSIEEINILKRMYKTCTIEQVATILNRSHSVVSKMKAKLRLTTPTNANWSKTDIAKVKRLYLKGELIRDIAKVVERTETATRVKINSLGLNNRLHVWSPKEVAKLTKLYNSSLTNKELAKKLGISVRSVYSKAYTLGLAKKHTK